MVDNLNKGEPQVIAEGSIEVVEEEKEAKYLGDFCIKSEDGGWINRPVAVFYQYAPRPPEAESPFFALSFKHDKLMITDGRSAFSEPIVCVVADNGEIIYSRWRHDFRGSEDGSVTVDGGRDYFKGSAVEEERIRYLTAGSGELKLFKNKRVCKGYIQEREQE